MSLNQPRKLHPFARVAIVVYLGGGVVSCSHADKTSLDRQTTLAQDRAPADLEFDLQKKVRSNAERSEVQQRVEITRPVDLSSVKEGVTTKEEILSLFGAPDAIDGERLVYKVWRKPHGPWRPGVPDTHFHPGFAEWIPQTGELKLLFNQDGVLSRKELPGDF